MRIGGQARRLAYASMLMLAVLATACSARRSRAPVEERWVEVDNRNYADMNVYVVQGGRRTKLGLVNGNSQAKLMLPRSLSHGFQTLRFEMDPVGSNRQRYTMDLTVPPGENIMLTIRP
jgi:hypothetical protein